MPTQDVDLASVSGGADFKTGIVEEVLGAEDDGYRAIGYIVQSQGKRIAVVDPIAQSQYGIGDTIPFLALRSKLKGSSLCWHSPQCRCRQGVPHRIPAKSRIDESL